MYSIIPQAKETTLQGSFFKTEGFPKITEVSLFSNEISIFKSLISTILTTESSNSTITCTHDPAIEHKEAYFIEIRSNEIQIKASTPQGMFHGLQSLWQLFLNGLENNQVSIPCGTITDQPRFSWRGVMLDTSRHFYSPTFVKKLIDLAALHHLNVFHWHLTDDQGWRLPIEAYPKLTEVGAYRVDSKTSWEVRMIGGFYTKQEIKEIVAYAQERHIEIVPEVDLPGHASAILASYPELGCTGGPYKVEDRYGIFKDVLCAGNDAIFPFIEKVFDTLVELFPSQYVHIGGDEVPQDSWNNCPACQKRVKELGLDGAHQIQSWITSRLVQMLHDRGKTAIGWDEVLEGTNKIPLPKDLIIMSWQGQEGGIQASSEGHRVIMTPLTHGCYLNFKHLDSHEEPGHLEHSCVKKSYEMDPITPEMNETQASYILGGQANLWSEVIYASRIAEYMLFPRLSAISESLWSQKHSRSLASFEQRLPLLHKRLSLLDTHYYIGPLED